MQNFRSDKRKAAISTEIASALGLEYRSPNDPMVRSEFICPGKKTVDAEEFVVFRGAVSGQRVKEREELLTALSAWFTNTSIIGSDLDTVSILDDASCSLELHSSDEDLCDYSQILGDTGALVTVTVPALGNMSSSSQSSSVLGAFLAVFIITSVVLAVVLVAVCVNKKRKCYDLNKSRVR